MSTWFLARVLNSGLETKSEGYPVLELQNNSLSKPKSNYALTHQPDELYLRLDITTDRTKALFAFLAIKIYKKTPIFR